MTVSPCTDTKSDPLLNHFLTKFDHNPILQKKRGAKLTLVYKTVICDSSDHYAYLDTRVREYRSPLECDICFGNTLYIKYLKTTTNNNFLKKKKKATPVTSIEPNSCTPLGHPLYYLSPYN